MPERLNIITGTEPETTIRPSSTVTVGVLIEISSAAEFSQYSIISLNLLHPGAFLYASAVPLGTYSGILSASYMIYGLIDALSISSWVYLLPFTYI